LLDSLLQEIKRIFFTDGPLPCYPGIKHNRGRKEMFSM